MKIKTILNEQYRQILKEAEDVTINNINPQEASIDTMADAVQDTMQDAGVSMSDTAATQTAQAVKQAAQEIGAPQIGVDAGKVTAKGRKQRRLLGGDNNDLVQKLDACLKNALKKQSRGEVSKSNLLVIGLPGSGKTSIILNWGKVRDVNIRKVNTQDEDLEAGLYGFTGRDATAPQSNKVTKMPSSYLDALDRPRSVLFIDEYNRASRSNRVAIADLVADHRVAGEDTAETRARRIAMDLPVDDGYRHFDNLLFTVAAMNPPDDGTGIDTTADNLMSYEWSRFTRTAVLDSKAEKTADYIKDYVVEEIEKLDDTDPDFWEDAIKIVWQCHLIEYICKYPGFHFDGTEQNRNLVKYKRNQLNSRLLVNGLTDEAITSVDAAKDWVKNDSKILDTDQELLINILNNYKSPSREWCKAEVKRIRQGMPSNDPLAALNKTESDDNEYSEDDAGYEEDEKDYSQEDDATIAQDGQAELARMKAGKPAAARGADIASLKASVDAWND